MVSGAFEGGMPSPVDIAAGTLTLQVVSSGGQIEPGLEVPPFCFAVLFAQGDETRAIVGSRERLMSLLVAAMGELISYAVAEHENGLHPALEPGCPLCVETSGDLAG